MTINDLSKGEILFLINFYLAVEKYVNNEKLKSLYSQRIKFLKEYYKHI